MDMQREVVVVSGVRTAIGDFGGGLKDVAPTELGARVVREALARAGVDTLELGTDDDLVDAVLRFADLKKQRSRLANWTGPANRSIAHVRPVAQAPAGSPR